MAQDRALFLEAAAHFGVKIGEYVEPEDKFLKADRIRLHYLDWGTAGKPPIVFLHGGGQNAHTWDFTALTYRPDYHVIAIDLPGHGDSEWSEKGEYGVADNAHEVAALIDALGLRRFVLVGMSLGGMTSIVYAGAHADLLAGLVIVDVGPVIHSEGTNQIRDFLSSPETEQFDSVDAAVEQAQKFNPLRPEVSLRYSILHNLRQLPNGKWIWKYDRRRRDQPQTDEEKKKAQEEQHRRTDALWDDVRRITCPTLVVRGGVSKVFHAEDAAKLATTLPDGDWVEVPNAGHTVQGDNPPVFIEEVGKFLRKIDY